MNRIAKGYLKPCPFCGSTDICDYNNMITAVVIFYGVFCGTCGAKTGLHDTLFKATVAWNRRVSDENQSN